MHGTFICDFPGFPGFPVLMGTLITTPVSLLTNEFDVQSILHGQVSLAAVSQIYVIHEAMNGCKNLKIH